MFWRQPMSQFYSEHSGGYLYIWLEGGNPAFSAFIQNHGRSPFLLVGVRSTAQDKHWLAAMVRRGLSEA